MLKMAWRNIWRNRRRALLHVGIIAFAVMVSSFVRSMQKGIYENLVLTLAGMHTGYLQVKAPETEEKTSVLDGSFEMAPTVLENLAKIPHVTGAAPRVETSALASSGELSRGVWVMGFDLEAEASVTAPQDKIVEGRMPAEGEDAALLPRQLARLVHLKVGDTLLLVGEGYQGQPAYGKYPVVGLLNLHSPDLDRRLVYLTMPAAQDFLRTEGRLTSIALGLDAPRHLHSIQLDAQSQLTQSGLEVLTWEQLMPEIKTAIFADEIGNKIMVFILYLIITLGISGTMVVMALERRYEFGVMMALGMRRGRLSLLLIVEGMLLALLGVLAGLLVSIPMVAWFHFHPIPLTGSMAEGVKTFGVEPVITFSGDPATFVAQAMTVLVISLLLGLLPVRMLMRIKPVRALREGK